MLLFQEGFLLVSCLILNFVCEGVAECPDQSEVSVISTVIISLLMREQQGSAELFALHIRPTEKNTRHRRQTYRLRIESRQTL